MTSSTAGGVLLITALALGVGCSDGGSSPTGGTGGAKVGTGGGAAAGSNGGAAGARAGSGGAANPNGGAAGATAGTSGVAGSNAGAGGATAGVAGAAGSNGGAAAGTGGAAGSTAAAGGAMAAAGGAMGGMAGAPAGMGGAAVGGGPGAGSCRPNPPAGTWSQATSIDTPAGMSAATDDAIFIASVGSTPGVQRWNGSALTTDLLGSVSDVWAAAPDDVWAVGASSWHRDATGWIEVPFPSAGTSVFVRSLWRLASNDIFAGGDGVALRWNGSAWSTLPTPLPTSDTGRQMVINGIFAASDTDVWAVGTFVGSGAISALEHWNGTLWTLYTQQGGVWVASPTGTFPHEAFNGIWGSGPADIWVVGSSDPGKLIHYDGANWTNVALPNLPSGVTLSDVWGACAADVWLVGWSLGAYDPLAQAYTLIGASYHFDGQTWSPLPAPADQLTGVTTSASNVWIAGSKALYSRMR